jgi:hypothetical protein
MEYTLNTLPVLLRVSHLARGERKLNYTITRNTQTKAHWMEISRANSEAISYTDWRTTFTFRCNRGCWHISCRTLAIIWIRPSIVMVWMHAGCHLLVSKISCRVRQRLLEPAVTQYQNVPLNYTAVIITSVEPSDVVERVAFLLLYWNVQISVRRQVIVIWGFSVVLIGLFPTTAKCRIFRQFSFRVGLRYSEVIYCDIDPLIGNGSINTFPRRPILDKQPVTR